MTSLQSFTTPGTHDWPVPAGITTIRVDVRGAEGGGNAHAAGGKGGRVFGGRMAVDDSGSVRMIVGEKPSGPTPGVGNGGAGGGPNAGAGGGRTTIEFPIDGFIRFTAGGGGGAGVESGNTAGFRGGDGGASTGEQGLRKSPDQGGQGGTQTSGGQGGLNAGNGSAQPTGAGGAGTTGFDDPAGGGGGAGMCGGGGGGTFGAVEGYGGGGGSNWSGTDGFGHVSGTSVRGFQTGHGSAIIEWNHRPVAVITGPTGVVSDTSQPTVTWDYSDPDQQPDPQEAFRVRVMRDPAGANEQIYNTGFVSSSATSHQLPALANGEDYQVEVTVRQVASGIENDLSLPVTETFTLDLDAPAAPTFAATAEHDQARVRLDLDDPGTIEPPAEWYTVEFRDDPDDPWTVVRGAAELPTGSPVVHYDYEAPFGRTREYRATAFIIASDQVISSDRSFDDVTLSTVGRWITDVLDPSMFHGEVDMFEQGRSWEGMDVVHVPADMDTAVVESMPTVRSGAVGIWSKSPAEHGAVVGLIRSTRTLLYRDRRDSFYFRWSGARTSTQMTLNDGANLDAHSASMVEVARPS